MDDNSLLMLPHLDVDELKALAQLGIHCLPQLMGALGPSSPKRAAVMAKLSGLLGAAGMREVAQVVERLPVIHVKWKQPQPAAKGGKRRDGEGGAATSASGAVGGWLFGKERDVSCRVAMISSLLPALHAASAKESLTCVNAPVVWERVSLQLTGPCCQRMSFIN